MRELKLTTILNQGVEYNIKEFIKEESLTTKEGILVEKVIPYYNGLNLEGDDSEYTFSNIMELYFDSIYYGTELERNEDSIIFEKLLELFDIR